jgi:fructose-1,6-bisphosphatase/inositol monophosphatase family enzyme
MSLNSINWPLVVIGCMGGIVPDLVRFAKGRYDANIGDYFKRWNYWVGLLVLVALGGLAAAFGGPTTAGQALVYGYAAPEFFSRMVAKQGLQSPAAGSAEGVQASEFSVRRWWSL